MKVIHKRDCTVLRVMEGECAVYYGTTEGKLAVGVIGENIETGDLQTIDAAMRGVALMLVNDEDFIKMMAEIYIEHVTNQNAGSA